MKLTFEQAENEELQVIIRGDLNAPEIPRIIAALNQAKVLSRLFLYQDGRAFLTPVSDIAYFQTERGRVLAVTERGAMESKHKLYELSEMLHGSGFVQISKGVLVNVHEIVSVEPEFSGNYTATLKNRKAALVISRSYFKAFRNYVEKEL